MICSHPCRRKRVGSTHNERDFPSIYHNVGLVNVTKKSYKIFGFYRSLAKYILFALVVNLSYFKKERINVWLA